MTVVFQKIDVGMDGGKDGRKADSRIPIFSKGFLEME